MARYDTAIVNGTVVMPYLGAMRSAIGVREGRIAALADAQLASTPLAVPAP